MSVDPNDATLDELEACFVNNAELDRITAELNKFNPIRVMRMEGMEIRHSAILGWLLDPNETHGFGDAFLKAFLGQSLRGSHSLTPTALDVVQADLQDTEVQREKQNIDLFVSSARNGWSFVIENKFHSQQSEEQLARYRIQAEKEAKDMGNTLINRGIFLTLGDETPNDPSYVTIQYSDICNILTVLIRAQAERIGPEARQFLIHYLDVIQEATGMSQERAKLELLAKTLYRQNKRAIDFVIEHGKSTEFAMAAEEVFGQDLEFGAEVHDLGIMYSNRNDRQLSFLPLSWRDSLGGDDAKGVWGGCERWWAGYPVICWFQLNTDANGVKGTMFLYAELGPLFDHEQRVRFIEEIGVASPRDVLFRSDANRSAAKYSKFLKGNSRKISDVSDTEAIAGAMRGLLEDFQPTFDAIGKRLAVVFNSIGGQDG